MLTPQDLNHFTGTEQWFAHWANRKVTYTEGVQHFAEEAGAHWFLDIVATELLPHCLREEFLSITMTVTGQSAKIVADDGNGKVVWSKDITYTDCPEGEWKFFMAPGGPGGSCVVMVPSEY